MSQVDLALNLLWLILVFSALVSYGVSGRKRRGFSLLRRIFGGVAVFLASLALFPCISASDDLVQLEWYGLHSKHAPAHDKDGAGHRHPEKSLATLVRLLEALEAAQLVQACSLVVLLLALAMVSLPASRLTARSTPNCSGRAPPALRWSFVSPKLEP